MDELLLAKLHKRKGLNETAESWKSRLQDRMMGLMITNSNQNQTNDQRIINILKELSLDKVLSSIPNPAVQSKNALLSVKFRNEGNDCFRMQDYMGAHKKYTQSIAYAIYGSQELSLAFANRSAVLFSTNYISDCLIDINRALEVGYPGHGKTKLLIRKASCYQALNYEKSLIQKILDEARQWLENVDEPKRKPLEEKIKILEASRTVTKKICYKLDIKDTAPKLKSENISIPGLSDSAMLQYSKKYGRHIVATKNIKPGEIVGVQKPYANVVLMMMRYNVCWHCAKQTWCSLPCDGCSEVIFCSKSCQNQANVDYHDIECYVMRQMMAFGIRDNFLSALQLSIMAIKESNNSFEALKNNTDNIENSKDPVQKGFIDGKFEPTKFSSAYSLASENIPFMLGWQRSSLVDGLIMAYYLAKKIGFVDEEVVGDLKILKDSKQYVYLIGLIEKFAKITVQNGFAEGLPGPESQIISFSSAIVSSLSFFNHSCNPSLVRSYRDGSLVMTSISVIKKGEQIFDNYGLLYSEQEKEGRQARLQYYGFECDCEACKYNWPIPKELIYPEMLRRNLTSISARVLIDFMKFMGKIIQVESSSKSDVQKNNQVINLSKELAEASKINEKFHKLHDKKSFEIYKSARLLEHIIMLSQSRFFVLPGSIDSLMEP